MVYQVYINWSKQPEQYDGRLILVFPNRQCADEFYNVCITSATTNTWTSLTRQSPQFWSWNEDPETLPWSIGMTNAAKLRPIYMACRIGGYDGNHGQMPVIPSDPTGDTEYKSGHSFYVRTKATPHLYWFYDGSNIVLSNTKRSKFQIDRETSADATEVDARHVLVRKDKVRITAHSVKNTHTVGLYGDYVCPTNSATDFDFGSFYNGDFGVSWNKVDGVDGSVVYKSSYAGDMWEVVS